MPETHDLSTGLRHWAQRLAMERRSDSEAIPTRQWPVIEYAPLLNQIPPSGVIPILLGLARDADDCLDRSPREAWGLASAAYCAAQALGDARTLAETALTLAIVLNRLGDFREARTSAEQATTLATHAGDQDRAARAMFEAAWADVFIGDLHQALDLIGRARQMSADPLIQARCHWIEGRVLSDQSQLPEAAAHIEKACDAFRAAGLELEAARCQRDHAFTLIRSEGREAIALLEQLRGVFQKTDCPLDASICDLVIAIALFENDRFPQAAEVLKTAQSNFAVLSAGFFVAACERDLAGAFRHFSRPHDSLRLLQQARDYFLSHGIRVQVSTCSINLGNIYYALNRYDEALVSYQEAAHLSLEDGRELRTAYLFGNMAMAGIKQGQFSRSLDYLHRALQIATAKNRPALAAAAHQGLATCYRELGVPDAAMEHFKIAKAIHSENRLREGLMTCNIELAKTHIARGEMGQALDCLNQASSVAAEDGLESIMAVCDRLLAQTEMATLDKKSISARLKNARALFLKNTQTVDVALCDLTEGEMHLRWNEINAAARCFRSAHRILSPSFPDQAWRAEHGLGRCAWNAGKPLRALAHYRRAVETVTAARSSLATEQLSNDFFAHRQSVFDEALEIAAEQEQPNAALETIEASKARTFLALLQHRGWKLRPAQEDAYVSGLIASEKELRYKLHALRGRIAVQVPKDVGEPFRSGAEIASISAAALEELNALSRSYESVVAQLRLATTGLAGVSAPGPFDLEKFRAAANAALGSDWAALDYYLSGDALTVIVVSPNHLDMMRKQLSQFDHAVLEHCTGTDPVRREMVYNGKMHGHPTQVAYRSLQRLHELLIPPGLQATTLLVVPHQALHTLPFHALVDGQSNAFLTEQHTLIYAPSLQAMQHLLQPSSAQTICHPLVVGISRFGDRARPLPHVPAEVARVCQAIHADGESWLETDARRQRLMDLGEADGLQRFDLIHLATHAVVDPAAPHDSHILLEDGALSALDVLDLSLGARLVTLSGCETALGKGGPGDEWFGLANAFFYAGAQAVLATLWPVEDEAMVELTGRFYDRWANGTDAATSLRRAQLDMLNAGYSPYQWAPFVLIGRP